MRTLILFLLACITFGVLVSLGFQDKERTKSPQKAPVPARIDCTKWWCCETTEVRICCPETTIGMWTVKSASGSFQLPDTLLVERMSATGEKLRMMGKKFELKSLTLTRKSSAP